MPFTIDDFPIEVNRPEIDVILPVGTHVLELIVEDSAGYKSAPDRVWTRVGKKGKTGLATKPVNWKAYLISVLAWAAFGLYIWWAFFREG